MTIDVTTHTAGSPVAQKRKKGFTLTEIAIVLGIIGLILGAIWTAAAAVYNNQRVAHANTAILQLVQGIRTLYANSSSAAGLTTANLITARAVPSDLVNAAGTGLVGPWPNSTLAVYIPVTNDSFTIQMTNVPQGACSSLILAVSGNGRDPGLFAVRSTTAIAPIAAAVATTAAPTASSLASPPTAANAAAACSGATNPLDFGFSLK